MYRGTRIFVVDVRPAAAAPIQRFERDIERNVKLAGFEKFRLRGMGFAADGIQNGLEFDWREAALFWGKTCTCETKAALYGRPAGHV